jgi:phosphoribosyl-AMP cyclohydrolase / phosphoribosyl-ATP pyrophosphohydrolase
MLTTNIDFDIERLDWEKCGDLIPVIVQDADTHTVLMLAYMNKAALQQTLTTKQVTFYSRSKKRLWTKGETSGNFLQLINITADCDQDTLLIQAKPLGPTCHRNTKSCFNQTPNSAEILLELENTITKRIQEQPTGSYVATLYQAGVNKIAQKVGEEGVEVAIAAVAENTPALLNEAADLLFHLLVLLASKKLTINDVMDVLSKRAKDTFKNEIV